MNTFKTLAIRTLAVSALTLAALSSANAAVFFRTGVVVVRPAAVFVTPVIAPVVVVPVCRFVTIPVMSAFTGVTYLVTRRVCN